MLCFFIINSFLHHRSSERILSSDLQQNNSYIHLIDMLVLNLVTIIEYYFIFFKTNLGAIIPVKGFPS